MSENLSSATPRRGGRRGAASSPRATRRRSASGPELMGNLDDMVDQLIKENRALKRQVDQLTTRGGRGAGAPIERTLRTIQRRLERAVTPPTRRRRTVAAAPRRTRRARA
jgi:transcription elongation GreA/GreB family factor